MASHFATGRGCKWRGDSSSFRGWGKGILLDINHLDIETAWILHTMLVWECYCSTVAPRFVLNPSFPQAEEGIHTLT